MPLSSENTTTIGAHGESHKRKNGFSSPDWHVDTSATDKTEVNFEPSGTRRYATNTAYRLPSKFTIYALVDKPIVTCFVLHVSSSYNRERETERDADST